MKHIITSATSRIDPFSVLAAPKGSDSYVWFTFTANSLGLVSKQGTKINLQKGDLFGVRYSSDKKSIRLITEKLGPTKVFSLSEGLAEFIAKRCKPASGNSKDGVAEDLDVPNPNYKKLQKLISDFQKQLQIYSVDSIDKVERQLNNLYAKYRKGEPDPDDAYIAQITSILKQLKTNPVSLTKKTPQNLIDFAESMVKVAKRAKNYWSDDEDGAVMASTLIIDILSWVALASALQTNNLKDAYSIQRGMDSSVREEIPDKVWRWIDENL